MSPKFFSIEDRFSPARHNAHNTDSPQQIVTIYDNWTELTTKRTMIISNSQLTCWHHLEWERWEHFLSSSSNTKMRGASQARRNISPITGAPPLPTENTIQHSSDHVSLGKWLDGVSVCLLTDLWLSRDKSSNYQVNRTLLISLSDGVPSQPQSLVTMVPAGWYWV